MHSVHPLIWNYLAQTRQVKYDFHWSRPPIYCQLRTLADQLLPILGNLRWTESEDLTSVVAVIKTIRAYASRCSDRREELGLRTL